MSLVTPPARHEELKMARKIDIAARLRAGYGRTSVGQGLVLYVRGRSALWYFHYRDRANKRRRRTLSIGSAIGPKAIGITEARARRAKAWADLLSGVAITPARGAGKTFAEALETFIAEKSAGYRGGKEIKAFENLARLSIARVPLDQIDRDTVKSALTPWFGKPTAEKMRVRIAQVFAHEGKIDTANPAACLQGGLPALAKPVKHLAAMAWQEVPAFIKTLGALGTPAALALQWTILTAARAGETLGATFGEIDTAKALWAIPGARMKKGKAHSVPLAPEALALLGPRGAPDARVFGIDEKAMRRLVSGYTVHGFRSSFTDWAAEAGFDFEQREIALAHAVGSQTARAYSRSAQVERRMAMMQAWAAFCLSGAG
jgi:integrase